MTKQTLIWTALPYGVGPTGRLRVSAFLSPRLSGDSATETLASFPDFLDWPACLADVKLSLKGAQPVAAERVRTQTDSTLWRSLFPPSMPVEPHEPQPLAAPILSYPHADLAGSVRTAWINVAAKSLATQPKHSTLLKLLGSLAPTGHVGDLHVLARQASLLDAVTADPALPDFSVIRNREIDGVLARDPSLRAVVSLIQFHQPTTSWDPDAPLSAQAPQLDFHSVVSALSEYPQLLRLLGLVIDLELDPDEIPFGDLELAIASTWEPAKPDSDVSSHVQQPWTAATRNDWGLWPRSREAKDLDPTTTAPGPDMDSGLFRLHRKLDHIDPELNHQPAAFEVVTVDVDGAVLKTTHLAATLRRNGELGSPSGAPVAGLPALRSAGLSLTRRGHGSRMKVDLHSAAELQRAIVSDEDPIVYAEDVVEALRLDVFDSVTKRWYSLTAREGSYTLTNTGQAVALASDEGSISPSFVQAGGSKTPDTDPVRLSETLASWSGWSLAAPRPGIAAALAEPQRRVGDPAPALPPALADSLAVEMRPVRGSLPRLRFGRRYRLRARSVDLAGNGWSLSEADAIGVGHPDPSAPGIVPYTSELTTFGRFEPLPPPDLVLQSPPTAGESLELIVVRSGDRGPITGPASRSGRHLAPPVGAELLAEMHGMFDGMGVAERKAAYASYREEGFDVGSDVPGRPVATKADLHALRLHPEPRLAVPYSPDPACAAAVLLQGDNGLPQVLADVSFQVDAGWPAARSIDLQVVAVDEGEPIGVSVGARRGSITVTLPQGADISLALATRPAGLQWLSQMALWQWLEEDPTTSWMITEFQQPALNGRLWMLSPPRPLRLVHAVPRPLHSPIPHLIADPRDSGLTSVTISGVVDVDAKSTGQVDIEATWDELRDDPADPIADPTVPVPTKTVWRQMVVPRTPETPLGAQLVPVEVTAMRQEFDDTKHRVVAYTAIGTTRFSEFFAGDAGARTRTTPPERRTTISISSSARPEPPVVHSVVPAFRWETVQHDELVVRRWRHGDLLRVYLQRPWWSSGDGEELAVIFAPAGSAGAGTPFQDLSGLAPFVTQWGADPTMAPGNTPLTKAATAASFALGRAVPDLSVPGVTDQAQVPGSSISDGVRLTAAVHRVRWNTPLNLWQSDVLVQTQPAPEEPALTVAGAAPPPPFVRLALSRYQRNAIHDCELSSVVLADYAQPVPSYGVTFDLLGPGEVRIVPHGGPLGVVWIALLETLDPRLAGDGSDDSLGWLGIESTKQTFGTAFLSLVLHTDLSFSTSLVAGRRLRVAVRAYEERTSHQSSLVDQRLVYADHQELNRDRTEWLSEVR